MSEVSGKKRTMRGRRFKPGSSKTTMLTVRFQNREEYERVCLYAQDELRMSINQFCAAVLLEAVEQKKNFDAPSVASTGAYVANGS